MSIEFQSAVVFVKDIEAARRFYEDVLEQALEFDFGPSVSYVGGLALWQIEHAREIVFGESSGEVGQGELELYFETDDMDAVMQRLTDAGVELVHPLREQPWGQRVVRFYDLDKHIVEVGEPIPVFVSRFLAQGMSVEEASERTSVPLEVVQKIAKSQ